MRRDFAEGVTHHLDPKRYTVARPPFASSRPPPLQQSADRVYSQRTYNHICYSMAGNTSLPLCYHATPQHPYAYRQRTHNYICYPMATSTPLPFYYHATTQHHHASTPYKSACLPAMHTASNQHRRRWAGFGFWWGGTIGNLEKPACEIASGQRWRVCRGGLW